MIAEFQKLEDIILVHTPHPVRSELRNHLSFVRDQVEAYAAAANTIKRLKKENLAVKAQAARRERKLNAKILQLQEQVAKLKAKMNRRKPGDKKAFLGWQ